MSGFLGSGDVQATGGGFLGSEPTQRISDVAADIPGLDDILASEGAQRVKPILQAIIGQESGGNAGVGNSVDGARGVGQIMPGTFKQFAKPGERIDNPSDNLRVAARLVNHLYDKAGGDPGKIAAGYFSGEGNIGTDRAYKADHADGNGKRVSSYVSDVLGRMGSAQPAQDDEPAQEEPQQPQQPAITGPKWSEVVQRPSFQKMTPAERELARSEYFNRYLAPNIPEEEQQTARATFIERSKGMDPKEPGMFDGIAETLGGIRHAIRQAAGTLPEQIEADKLQRRDQAGVMSGMDGVKSGPDFSDLPVTPDYLRAMQAQWNAATPAQREQMAARKDHMGVVAQRMNADRADFKPTETSDVFDKTAEARARRLIQNGMNGNDAAAIGKAAALRDVAPGEEQGMARAEVSNFDFDARKKFNEDPFWSHAAVRGAVKGYEGFKQGYIGVNQAIGDMLGVDVSGQEALGRESRGKVDAMGERGDYLQRNFEGTISSISQQLPALLGGAVTGSEGLVLGSMFAQTFGQEYSQGRAQGQDTGTALKRAGLYGAFEVIGEKFGLGERMDMLRNAARGVETNVLAKWMANTLKHELPGEMLTTTGQFLTDKADGIGMNQNAGIGDYLQQMADTVTQTIMQGGIMSAATGGVNTARQHMNGALDRSRNSELDAGTAQRDAMSKWNANGLSPRIEPTLDSYAAGLSPEDQKTDAEARAELGLLDDEVPASTLLGAEAKDEQPAGEQAQVGQKYVRVTKNDGTTGFELEHADSEPQEPASMRVSEPTALDAGESAAPAAEGKKTKLTPFEHPDLSDVDVRGELAHMAYEAGWEQVGGKMIRSNGTDQSSDVVGRTPWIPKQPWYQMMPERLNEEDTIEAVGKALQGHPMTAKEKRVVGNMLDFAKASLEEQRKWRDQVHDEVGATSDADYEQVASHADKVEAMDEDIPLDLNDPRSIKGDKLTDEEIDGIFGIKQQSSGVSQDAGPADTRQGREGAGTPAAAESDAFQLQGETPDEVRAKTEAAEKAKEAEKKAKAEADAKEKKEREQKDIKQRATAAADNFQLGEDPEAALSGQKDIFADAPKIDSLVDSLSDQDALNLVGLYRGKGTTENPASARKTLKEEFQPVDIENGLKRFADTPAIKAEIEARRAPKTEKEAKAKRQAKQAEAEKPKSREDELGAMFDELMAEETGKAKPKTEKEAKAKRTKKAKAETRAVTVSPESLYQPNHAMFKRFAEFKMGTPYGERAVSFSGATNPAKYEEIYGEPGGIVNVRYPISKGESIERAGVTYKGVLTREKAEELVRKLIAEHDETYDPAEQRAEAARNAEYQGAFEEGRQAAQAGKPVTDMPGQYARKGVKKQGWTEGHAAGSAEPRTAGEAAKSAAKNSAEGFANAIKGLGALFDPTASGSGPVISEESYNRAVPLFKMAVENFGEAAADIRDVMRAVIKAVTEQFGAATTNNMKPYIVRFIKEYEEGKFNEPATGTDPKQAGADNAHEAPGRDNSVHGRPDGTGAAGTQHGGQVEGKQDAGPAADLVVHDARAPAGGEGRSDGVSEPNGEFVVDRGHSEPGNAEGSGATGADGTAATDREADGGISTPDGKSDVKTEQTFAEKVEAQRKAESVPVKVGDKANVDATLPLLLDGQREDVHFAEKRLSQPEGYGVLFANGTGTGKTYLSLGVIKRMVKQGKTNGIVAVPNQEVMNEWLASAPNLGIELHVLGDKQDPGKGVSITTYANLGDNMTLLDREHHFVVADEAHMLMAGKDANVTKALEVVRAVTKHHASAFTRARMLHRDLYGKIMTLREQETTLMLEREKGTAPIGAAKMLNDIAEELRPLLQEFDVALGHQKAELLETKPEDRARLLAVSATPFAWEKNVQWAEGYLFKYPQVRRTGAYNEPSSYQKYMISNFGWHMKNGKLNEPDAKVNRSLMQIQYNMNLRKAGVLSTRMLDVDKDYDRKFVLVDGGIGSRIDAALDWLRKEKDGIYSRYYDQANGQFDHLTKRRLLEAIKAKAAIDIIKQHHALGRKVVVFHDFNEGGGFQPFSFPGDPSKEVEVTTGFDGSKIKYTHGEFLADFAKAFPDLVGSDLAELKSPIETLREAFPNALFNNGTEKKRDALQAIKDFNNDEKADANLLVVQSDKNAGWSGHDKTGRYQRVLINLGLPTAPVKSIQIEGRIYRVGQKSNAIFRYLNTGTRFEKFAFATAIATRAETAENLAMGDYARGLKQSYIDAFLESGDYPPSANDGVGGKEQDRRSADSMTPYQKAISYYFANHKKNSRTKAQEGADYFATPEPLGLKMVEWLQPKAGESYMEPSAGHGAIARWFPESANLKAIEPSRELAANLSLNLHDPESVINEHFEDHHISNKYDGIAMNPPFGTAGKLAMEHIAKAFGHLKEGGRLIAIVPDGPAMNKRIEAWLTGSTTNARGMTSLNVPDARLDHVIQLPATTFKRAGTTVTTRIIIIDRVKGGNNGTGQARSTMVMPEDVRHSHDVNELFNWLEHMTVPPRAQVAANVSADTASVPELAKELTTPGQQGTIAGVTQHAHGRVVADQSKAVYKVKGDKLETDAPVVKVTTAAGKVLEGVWVPSKDMATAVDRFTWKPKGEANYFVRIKHVVRPLDDNPALLHRAAGGVEAGPLTKTEARKAVLDVWARAGKKNFGVPVEIVDTVDDLPDDLKAKAIAQGWTPGGDERFFGAYHDDGKVYIVASEHRTAKEVEETVHHEVYGHAALNTLMGGKLRKKMAELYHKLGGEAGILEIARKHGRLETISSYLKGLKDWQADKPGTRPDWVVHSAITEELLGFIAQEGPSIKRLAREIIGGVRNWLREKGFAKLAKYGDADIARILSNARKATLLGRAQVNSRPQMTMFRRETGESTRAVNLHPPVAPKFGLLDTPMRLAFEKTGALAVWRGAFRLLEKTADMALDNKVGEIIKAGLIDRYGLSDAIIERHEEMRVKMIAGVRTADRFLERLSGLTRNEYAVLYAAANNADVAAVDDMIKELPEDSQKALHEIKALVRDLGQEAVDLKMLDFDTFKANEMAYLHRSYLKHEAELSEGEKANRATRIKGDQFKARGLADIVASDRLMKWMPGFWGTRVKNGAITSDTIGQQFVRFERRDDPSPTSNLDGIEGEKPMGRLKEVVYWPVGEEIPEKFQDWHVEGEWTVRRTVGKNVVFRRDFTPAERKRMGEIEDIRYAMAKTINIAVHDVEVGKYFGWLAEGHAKLEGELPSGAEVIDDPRKAESRLQTFGKDVWVRVPDTKVKGTQVAAYGKLAGRYVPGPVWTDIRQVGNGAFFTSNVGKGYEKLLKMWKISKTALSPTVHVNNVMANVVMADWHDVSGKHLLQAASAWARKGKDAAAKRLIEDFQDHGGELGTFALTEMQREQLAPILEELLGESRKANDLNGIVNAAGVMSLLREGMVRQAAATLGQSKAGRVAGAIPRKMIDVYQLEDQLFRLAAYIKARESGLTEREAGRFARKSFLDYDIQAPWVVAAKRSGFLPFISFSYRAIPMLYQTVRDKPWKLMKLALVLGAVSAASAAFLGLDDDDEKKERRWLPREKSGKVWGMIPKMVRMPWNTHAGNPVFMDIRRFIPAGDITDLGASQGAVPLPPFLNVGGPLSLMAELMADKSLFTGKEINEATDTKGEAAIKVLDHIYKWAAPNVPLPTLGTIVPGVESGQFQTYAWSGIAAAARRETSTFGRDQNVPMAIGSALGVKLEGYSVANGMTKAKGEMQHNLTELRKDKAAAKRQYVGGGLSDADYRAKVQKIHDKEIDQKKDFRDRMTK